MKRLTVAGIFATIGGAAALLMVASILYSCRQGGHPHEMGSNESPDRTHSSVVAPAAEQPVASAQNLTRAYR